MQRVKFYKYATPLVRGRDASNWFPATYPYDNLLQRNYSKTHHAPLTRSQLKRYCDILGVPINASEAKIKQSFYKKSFLLHPDKNKSSVSGQKFNEISEAYQALLKHLRLSEDHSSETLTKNGPKHVRPWFQSHRKPPPSAHQQYAPESKDSVDGAHHFNERFDASSSTEYQSQASGWCHQNYKMQLKEDYRQRKEMREQSRGKTNEGECALM